MYANWQSARWCTRPCVMSTAACSTTAPCCAWAQMTSAGSAARTTPVSGCANRRQKSASEQIHNIAVQGPKSRELLSQMIWTPGTQQALADLGWFRFLTGRLDDYNGPPLMVSRTGYTGELGYEIWCHPSDAMQVWQRLWQLGEPLGLVPLGLDALDMLRIEAGLIFAGYEFCDQTDPFEAGIGFCVPLKSKQDDFIGREALLRRSANPQRKLVGLRLDGNEVAHHGDCVHVGRAQVGVITSATRPVR